MAAAVRGVLVCRRALELTTCDDSTARKCAWRNIHRFAEPNHADSVRDSARDTGGQQGGEEP